MYVILSGDIQWSIGTKKKVWLECGEMGPIYAKERSVFASHQVIFLWKILLNLLEWFERIPLISPKYVTSPFQVHNLAHFSSLPIECIPFKYRNPSFELLRSPGPFHTWSNGGARNNNSLLSSSSMLYCLYSHYAHSCWKRKGEYE